MMTVAQNLVDRVNGNIKLLESPVGLKKKINFYFILFNFDCVGVSPKDNMSCDNGWIFLNSFFLSDYSTMLDFWLIQNK